MQSHLPSFSYLSFVSAAFWPFVLISCHRFSALSFLFDFLLNSSVSMRVCVIGAGVSGLTAIKHCKEYGLDVVCYEAGQHVGGLWRYNTGDREGFGSVMRNTILNTSKEFVAFSDFPMGETVANFPHNREVHKYFEEYCDQFQLTEHITFGTKVLSVHRADDYEHSGNWIVGTESTSGKLLETFNAVMVCNGHHVRPFRPKIAGLEKFKGTVLHSHDYKDHRPFHDRRVLVVGFGNSGGDAACELARVAKQVFVSSRHGTWVTRRVVHNGYPRDVILRSRHFERAQRVLPKKLKQWLAVREYTSFFDHTKYGLQPKELPGESPVLLADDLALHLASGAINVRSGITHFTETTVHFEDGTSQEIDDVIVCTGYDYDFDFIEEGGLLPTEDNQVRLYKRMFVPKEKHHTLAIVGLVDPLGPTVTMAEMQSRAVAHIWAFRVKLPSEEQMEKEIDGEKAATTARFKCSTRKASLQIDHISYFDTLAAIIGCLPPLDFAFLLWNPKIGFLLNFGPVYASHYRLQGPHAWDQAATHISKTFHRVHRGMNPSASKVPGIPYDLLLLNTPTIIFLTAAVVFLSLLAMILLL